MLARCLARAAVAAFLATARAQVAGEMRVVVGPDDHLAAVAADPRIGHEHDARRHACVSRIHHLGVPALQVPAHQDRSAAHVARDIDAGTGVEADLLAQHLHAAASSGHNRDRASRLRRRSRSERSRHMHRACRRLDVDRASGRAIARARGNDGGPIDVHIAGGGSDRDRSARPAGAAFGQHLCFG